MTLRAKIFDLLKSKTRGSEEYLNAVHATNEILLMIEQEKEPSYTLKQLREEIILARINEAEYWRDYIFKPKDLSIPPITIMDFQLRIEQLRVHYPELCKIIVEHDKEIISLIDEQLKSLQEYLDDVQSKNEFLVFKITGSIEALKELKEKLK